MSEIGTGDSPRRAPSPDQVPRAGAPEPIVAVVGGTGSEGRAMALRLAAAGCAVLIGSRDAASAETAADEVALKLAGTPGARRPVGLVNLQAAADATIVVLCVPYAAHAEVLAGLRGVLAGKTVVDVVVPLAGPFDVAWRPAAGSAAEEAARILGPQSAVVAAFHNVSSVRLARLGEDVGCDVLVCADDPGAKAATMDLARRMGLAALDAGGLANAAVVEGLTAVLVGINRRYRAKGAGVKITHIPS